MCIYRASGGSRAQLLAKLKMTPLVRSRIDCVERALVSHYPAQDACRPHAHQR